MADGTERLRPLEHTYATLPTGGTRFWRTFLPWQVWRFVWINLKMIRIISKSHR
ncbi:MAG: hypothetical protein AB7O67_10515 [Vicinamibacterales bacterium]